MEFLSGILQSFAVGKEFKLYSQYMRFEKCENSGRKGVDDFPEVRKIVWGRRYEEAIDGQLMLDE